MKAGADTSSQWLTPPSRRVKSLFLKAVRRIIYELTHETVTMGEAEALSRIGSLDEIVTAVRQMERAPSRLATPPQRAVAAALFPADYVRQQSFIRERYQRSVHTQEVSAATQERRRVEVVIKQFRKHFPRYQEFTRSVIRLRSEQIARLRLGIGDHAALDQAMVQLDSLIVGYVERAHGPVYGEEM